MKKLISLVSGVDCFTIAEIFRKAAAHLGLVFHEGGRSLMYTQPIKEYDLDERLLALLAEIGIGQQNRPDCRNEIFTLVDKNPQKIVISGYVLSNYWNFKLLEGGKGKFDLRMSLCADLRINDSGIGFKPRAFGTYVSAGDPLSNFRMFKVLVDNDEDAPVIAKRLAASNGSILVPMAELGLDGIKKLFNLFEIFSRQNQAVVQVAMNGRVFDPAPYTRDRDLFVTKQVQPKILQAWGAQLKEYRAQLVI